MRSLHDFGLFVRFHPRDVKYVHEEMESENDMWTIRVDMHSVYIRFNASYDKGYLDGATACLPASYFQAINFQQGFHHPLPLSSIISK